MAGSASVDQESEIRGGTHGSPHDREAADKLRDGKFELAAQDASWRGEGKTGPSRPPARGRGWRPTGICPPWALHPRTGCPAEATVPVPPGRAARWRAAVGEAAPTTALSPPGPSWMRRRS